MNKNIKLAVAGAVLSLSAVSANAGIIIPAGEWTLDVNGNVNAFANYVHVDTAQGGGCGHGGCIAGAMGATTKNPDKKIGIQTGLLPAWLGFTGKTRQNDLDVEFTISIQPGVSANDISGDGAFTTDANSSGGRMLNRQTYVSFGDKSWGSIKLGKDLGIFASDAILSDMTLLGVGTGVGVSGPTTNTSNGGIGTGYIYAAWKGQIAYTTPNFNGFQATVGIVNPNMISQTEGGTNGNTLNQDRFGLEGKASYTFAADQFSGKVWVSGATYDVTTSATNSYTATAGDIGANVNAGNFGLTGYYYQGSGAGTTLFGYYGYSSTYGKRESDGGYLQLTYVLPTKTKLGLAWGESNLDKAASGDTAIVKTNERYTAGLYHPLTKHLNLVGEYTNVKSEVHSGGSQENSIYSAGAILFF